MVNVKGNIWLEGENGFMLGKGKALLLAEIEQTGSIAQAAQNLGLSYRKAWGMVQQLNTSHGSALVTKKPGGSKGGYANLTEIGRLRMRQFFTAKQEFENYLAQNSTLHE